MHDEVYHDLRQGTPMLSPEEVKSSPSPALQVHLQMPQMKLCHAAPKAMPMMLVDRALGIIDGPGIAPSQMLNS